MTTSPPLPTSLDDGLRRTALYEATRRRVATGRVSRMILWLWTTLFAAWIVAAVLAPSLGLLTLPLGMLGALRGERRWSTSIAVRVLADSFAAISMGRLVDAEAALDGLASSSWIPVGTRRLVAIQKGLVAVRRGDVRAALGPLDEAIALPAARGEADAEHQRAGALALRAFARASLGDRDEALTDVAAVRSTAAASDDALARATLAEALVLERAGERAALRELLVRERGLLRESSHPRERAVVRALERSVRTPKVTPYRVVEASEDLGDEPPVETWMARVAPGLAAFADTRRGGVGHTPRDLAAPAPTERGVAAVEASRASPGAPLWPLVLLAAGAFGGLSWLLTGVGAGFGPELGAPTAAHGSGSIASLVAAVLASAMTVAAGGRWMGSRRHRRRLAAVRAGGDATVATEELRALTTSVDDTSAAQAHLLLADRAERGGQWPEAVQEAEAGLARVSSTAARQTAGLLVPDLTALRAFALAVVGRGEEAEAELASLVRGYPHYPRALFRVRLVQQIRLGQLAEAAAHVETLAADLPLSLREETLADLVRAVGAPDGVGRAETARIAEELSADPALRAWIESVAPELLAAFEGVDLAPLPAAEAPATDGPRVAVAPVDVAPVITPATVDPADVAPARLPVELGDTSDTAAEAEAEAAAEDAHQGSSRASIARRTS